MSFLYLSVVDNKNPNAIVYTGQPSASLLVPIPVVLFNYDFEINLVQ